MSVATLVCVTPSSLVSVEATQSQFWEFLADPGQIEEATGVAQPAGVKQLEGIERVVLGDGILQVESSQSPFMSSYVWPEASWVTKNNSNGSTVS